MGHWQVESMKNVLKNKKIMIMAAVAAMLVLIATILVVVLTKKDSEPQFETVVVGTDEEGQPIYEERQVTKKNSLFSKPSKTEAKEEEIEYSTLLAYKENAKNGYMNNCVFLGDSRTVAAVSYGFLNDDSVLAQVGISHTAVATTTFVQNSGKQYTLDSYLKSHQVPVVYINYGVNGMNGISEDRYESTYEKLIDHIIELCPNSNIVLMGIWPVDDYGRYQGNVKNEWIDKYNAWLFSIAEAKGLYYLDVETVLKGSDGQIDPRYDAGDGLHYRACAYTEILKYIISHPVPGVSDEGEFVVKYVPPSGEYKRIMTEKPKLPENVVEVVPTPTPEITEPVVKEPVVCEHEFGEWIIEREPSFTEEGSRWHQCIRCGYIYYENIPILIPTPQVPVVTPTPVVLPTDIPLPEPLPTAIPSPEPLPEEPVPGEPELPPVETPPDPVTDPPQDPPVLE